MITRKLIIGLSLLLLLSACQENESSKTPKTTVQAYQEHQPLAHHQVALEILEASKNWINAFNKGAAKDCVKGYTSTAVMRAMPFGVKKGQQAIGEFWEPFIASGASQLIYTDVTIEVVDEQTGFLSANWSMNVGEGKIYQEKWEKKEGQWVLTYDDFEVLKQYEEPKENLANPIASHLNLEAVIKASMKWINGFNTQHSLICGDGYLEDATMNAVPFALLNDKKSIQGFWDKLIKDGAKNLTYHNPKFAAIEDNYVQLSAHWSMNIGEGKIYQEKWVKKGDDWVLGYDEFQVLKQY